MKLSIGDEILYRYNDKLYKGRIKSIQGDKIEIDDNTIELVIVAISKNTIADHLTFKSFKDRKGASE